MTTRRLPAPWTVDKIPGGYCVRDVNRAGTCRVGGTDLPPPLRLPNLVDSKYSLAVDFNRGLLRS
jgi:hypothetical protein